MNEEAKSRAQVRTPAVDEVLRRICRNIINFQHVESLLKYLSIQNGVRAPASQFAVARKRHTETMHKQTMGGLASKLLKNLLTPPNEDEFQGEIDEMWMKFRFSIDNDAEFVVGTTRKCGHWSKRAMN
jgi:hypothetical protein